MRKSLLVASSLLISAATIVNSNVASAQKSLGSETIKLNQIGFYPNGPKVAIVVNTKATKFSVISATNKKDTAFSGNLKKTGVWVYSNEDCAQADFTALTKPGSYVVYVKGAGTSYPFDIKDNANEEAAKGSLKGYYFQRASTNLPTEFAGKFARAAGHYDDDVLVHNSAANATRTKKTKINVSKGWYDAGDYNKYIVNSGITMASFFSLYEDFTQYNNTLLLNIPESSNQTPDVIDEANWNLRWMLTMQDPTDGGVYHKVTNPNFDPEVMPKDALEQRYVIMKSTAATLDFAGAMAHASRVYRGSLEKQFPGLADSCLAASKKAYEWAKKNPKALYTMEVQESLSNPEIKTGAYDDKFVDDEFLWASSELFVTTGDINYFKDARLDTSMNKNLKVPNWQSVGMLGLYSLIKHANKFKDNKEVTFVLDSLKYKFTKAATDFRDKGLASPYGVVMGADTGDFVWGSNAIAANQGMFLIKAYLLTNDKSFVDAAHSNLDYLLGRNGVGYSFLTGFGEKSTMNPHHRPSTADGIDEPVPGLLAGGPNPGQQDISSCNGSSYPSNLPALSYMDDHCSYASNEIAINWNAPFIYLSNAIEAIRRK